MKYSKQVMSEIERLFGKSDDQYSIYAQAKMGSPMLMRLIEESDGYPYHFIDSMINKHGKNAMSEIKKFLLRQKDIWQVYRDNYNELENARLNNGGKIEYSPKFVEKVKSIFADNPEIIEELEANSLGLRRLIDEERAYMDIDGMLKTIEEKGENGALEDFKAKADHARDVAKLYSMVHDEYVAFMNEQSQPGSN